MDEMKPIGILYEHPEWFKLLFAELERRGIAYEKLYVDEHWFDPTERESPYSLVVNRVSPSSYLRGHAGSILYARQYLAHLAQLGTPVVNGLEAYTLETSKALQLLLFERLGVRYPKARVVNHPSQLVAAAEGLTYPVIVKPNVGGSGALMQRFDTPDALAVGAPVIDFGVDRTALVQEYLAPEEGAIVRVEVLNGEALYSIKIFTDPNEGFNLCPADICQVPGTEAVGSGDASAVGDATASGAVGSAAGMTPLHLEAPTSQDGEACDFGAAALSATKKPLKIEAFDAPREVVDTAIRLVREGGLDVGGVEYLVAARDGLPYFYDVNALSNFVTDALNVVGFDPTARFVDYLERRAGLTTARSRTSKALIAV